MLIGASWLANPTSCLRVHWSAQKSWLQHPIKPISLPPGPAPPPRPIQCFFFFCLSFLLLNLGIVRDAEKERRLKYIYFDWKQNQQLLNVNISTNQTKMLSRELARIKNCTTEKYDWCWSTLKRREQCNADVQQRHKHLSSYDQVTILICVKKKKKTQLGVNFPQEPDSHWFSQSVSASFRLSSVMSVCQSVFYSKRQWFS